MAGLGKRTCQRLLMIVELMVVELMVVVLMVVVLMVMVLMIVVGYLFPHLRQRS